MSEPYPNGNGASTGNGRALFNLLNAVVDGGHLAALSEVQVKCWIVLMRHMDSECISFPSPETIARKIGHKSTRHIYRAISDLEAAGFHKSENDGGGRNHIAKRRMKKPETLADSARDKNTGGIGDKTLADSARNTGGIGDRNTGGIRQMNNTMNNPSLNTQQQHTENDAAVEVEIEGEEEEQKRLQAMAEYLDALKIEGTKAKQIIANTSLWPVHLAIHQICKPRNTRSVTGWIIDRATKSSPPEITAHLIYRLAKARFIRRINGVNVGDQVKYGTGFMALGDRMFYTKHLKPSGIEMNLPSTEITAKHADIEDG